MLNCNTGEFYDQGKSWNYAEKVKPGSVIDILVNLADGSVEYMVNNK